jgi:soluble lytic murein transglycosylase-like protein
MAHTASVHGVTPSQDYPLQSYATSPVSSPVERWFATRVTRPDASRWSEAQWRQATAAESPLTRTFLELRKARVLSKPTEPWKAKALAQWAQASSLRDRHLHTDPMWPYLASEILRNRLVGPKGTQAIESLLKNSVDGGCPRQRLVISEAESWSSSPPRGPTLETLLKRVASLTSPQARKRAAGLIAGKIPQEAREAIRPLLWKAVSDLPSVQTAHPWVRSGMPVDKELLQTLQIEDALRPVTTSAARRQCDNARKNLLAALPFLPVPAPGETLHPAILKAWESTAKCVAQTKGAPARLKYYEESIPTLEKQFGWAANAEGKLRVASHQWAAEDFDKALATYASVQAEAEKRALTAFAARAQFAAGRLYYERADKNNALASWVNVLDKHGDALRRASDEEMTRIVSLTTLTLMELKRPDEALAILDRAIDTEAQTLVDNQSSALTPFALYWSARLHAAAGREALAEARLTQLATDFFSTFYGAAGLAALERLHGNRFRLPPTRGTAFTPAMLSQAFPDEPRQHAAERTDTLLRFGLREDAICEIQTLALSPAKRPPQEAFARAMYLHAAGLWFDAIRAFDQIPRTYRVKLPEGVERVLFPRDFSELISHYAKRAEVDERLALSLIRQESVFNPKARSAVGAIGIMQLMPATANKELKHVPEGYLDVPPLSVSYPTLAEPAPDALSDDPDLGAAIVPSTDSQALASSPQDNLDSNGAKTRETDPTESNASGDEMADDLQSPEAPPVETADKSLLSVSRNIALGMHHLKRVLADLNSPILTLCAYNAGSKAAVKWSETFTREALPFVEFIPYRETRNYVKLIMRNYFYYGRYRPLSELDAPDASSPAPSSDQFAELFTPGSMLP